MLCSITGGSLSGKSVRCGIHLLYVMLFCTDHWHRYVLYLRVILYLSFVSFDLWFSMLCMGNCSGLFITLGGGCVCCICLGSGVIAGFSIVLGVNVWLFVIYLAFSVRGCGCILHGFGQS